MIVSWKWLCELVDAGAPVEEVVRRLMLAGLNHESTSAVGDDLAIDLEVTSNRPDCLSHQGVAREVSVLFGMPLKTSSVSLLEKGPQVETLTRVRVECPELCPRYTARVIRGVRVAASPAWLQSRLATLGVACVNNVVDITNYVLMECGQPLHAFDLSRLAEREIVVRRARPGETLLAIDHKTYTLADSMCVVADAKRSVALGGVMGGAETEVTKSTVDLLIEAAEFDPRSVRDTARKVALFSDSSYRFERGVDPAGIDWASRRCCELILSLCGGELAEGVIDVGPAPKLAQPIVLRLAQIPRVLGIDVPRGRAAEILTALGCAVRAVDEGRLEARPPSWRRDLSREIDLVEEIARIHGYDAIGENVQVSMFSSAKRDDERLVDAARHVLVACGFYEALTPSVVDRAASDAFSPWTDAPALETQIPLLRGAQCLRRSLVPSLLVARRTNEAAGNKRAELFEIAHAYWPQPNGLPREEQLLSLASGGDYADAKGVIETLVAALDPRAALEVRPFSNPALVAGHAGELWLAGDRLGFVGECSTASLKAAELRSRTTVAEVRLAVLARIARGAAQQQKISPYPAVDRDVNLVVDESCAWADVLGVISGDAQADLERVEFVDEYRHAEQIGPGKKSLLFTLTYRGREATLTSAEVDERRDRLVAACAAKLGAKLRA